MNYTLLVLAALGLFGILLHNLVKLNDINRKNKGEINLANYFKIERFSIAISVCVVLVALMVRAEIKELQIAGKWLGLSFFAIGYMSQSLLVKFMGKAEKIVNEKTGNNE